jgi:hypothetical protein
MSNMITSYGELGIVFLCAKFVLHILNVCLKNILSYYQIPHADISITPVIRLGSDSDILLLFISYGASSATDIDAVLLS